MGAADFRQARSDAVCWADGRLLTCADAREQSLRTPECPVRIEVLSGSIPTRPRSFGITAYAEYVPSPAFFHRK